MGSSSPTRIAHLWRMPPIPRTATGEFDARATLVLIARAMPVFIAMWGLLWLTGRGIGTGRWEVAIPLATAVPLWISARAWRLPWWLHAGAASFPLSVGVVALVHADATGLVRGAKFAYGAILFLAIAAWARSPRRRIALGLVVASLAVGVFGLSYSNWMLLATSPLTLMRGTLDWHNQLAALMLFGLALGTFLMVLGRGVWSAIAGAAAIVCATGVILSGSRYGFALACGVVAAALVVAIVVALAQRTVGAVGRWAIVVVGSLLLPVLLRSSLFFPGDEAALNPFATMARRGGLESSGAIRVDWWLAAWQIGIDHPLAGSGLLTFAEQVVCQGVRPQWHPHNEWAYAWAEGGLIGLIPLLLLLAGVVALVIRAVRPWPGAAGVLADPARWGALVATGVAVADLVIEYDLYYTVLIALLAVAGGVASAPTVRLAIDDAPRSRWIAWAALVIALIIAVAAIMWDPTFEVFPWDGGYSRACLSG